MFNDPRDLAHVVALYDGDIRYADQQTGRLLAPLRREGRLGGDSCYTLFGEAGTPFVEWAGHTVRLKPGEWSGWLPFDFKAGWWGKTIRVWGRFYAIPMAGGAFRLYLSPLFFDPARAPESFVHSAPPDFARSLAARHGAPFKTHGWPTDTAILDDRLADDEMYLADWRRTMAEQSSILLDTLARDDGECFFGVLTPPDQMQHMFREGTPAGEPRVREAYQSCDKLLGEILARHDRPGSTIMVISDHGFGPWDRTVHLNTWLAERGFLRFHDGAAPGRPPSGMENDPFPGVDWSRSYAYAIGLNGLYLNMAGREPEGIVRPGPMAEEVMRRLTEALFGFVDPDNGAPVVKTVRPKEALFRGARMGEAMDLLVGFHDGYRASWETAMGAVPARTVEDNLDAWNNEHLGQPGEDRPGILFTNRPIRSGPRRAAAERPAGGGAFPSVMDVAPSVAAALGVAADDGWEGESIWA